MIASFEEFVIERDNADLGDPVQPPLDGPLPSHSRA